MKVSLFDFQLPPARIAQVALEPRDSARMLHVDSSGTLHDRMLRQLPSLLNPGDIVVFNNSRVIPARLYCEVDGKKVEVLLHRMCGGLTKWQAFAKPARKLKPGMQLEFGPGFVAQVEGRTEDGQVLLQFADKPHLLMDKLYLHGHMPLPPYIDRPDTPDDANRYQTIFAKSEGSVAAPTAGLHFTDALFAALAARDVETAFVTLHVGAGTFQPVKVEDTAEHKMHSEWGDISAGTAAAINAARARGGKVVAVGTTSLRVLETAAAADGTLHAWCGETDIFITPGYRFKLVQRLLTNFHLPKSTLFMLVCAFCGIDAMQKAYAHAIAQEYRFYSYGDASLLERAA